MQEIHFFWITCMFSCVLVLHVVVFFTAFSLLAVLLPPTMKWL